MKRAKYPMVISLCVVLAAACNDGQSVSAPQSRIDATLIPPATSGVSASGLRNVIFDKAPTLCLAVAGDVNANGTSVTTAACSGATSQQFTLDTAGAVRVFGDKCLDADMGRGQNGDKVQIWTCNGYNQQRWTLTAAGQLVGVGGKCVDVAMGSTVPGAKVQLWTCYAGSANQKWRTNGLTAAPAPTQPAVPMGVSSASGVGSAELPRTFLNTAAPAVTGRTINVPAGGDLQGALNAALPGDQIVLVAGATYVGNFVLPAKVGATAGQWITVRTSGILPAEGTRVSLADAAQMPKILTPNAAAAIATVPGTQGWRFTGVEVGATSAVTMTYTLVAFGTAGADQNVLAQVPSRLVLDRSYVHGSPTLDVRRCVALNSAATAVIDSYVSECHSRNGDSQAVMGWNGPGPFKIVNNRLEGGHENIAFGGADPSVPGLIPSDIEIRRNHVIKPASWRGVWPAKNMTEFKAGQRILLEGNVFENNWADAQNGFAFLWWSANADGSALWSVTQDITFRFNIARNIAGGFNLTDRYNASLPRASRYTIYNNVITGLDGSNGRLYQVNGTLAGLTIVNNSGVGVNHDLLFVTPDQPLPDLVFRNNVTGGLYTLFAGGSMGNAALAKMGIPAANVTGNVFASGSGAGAVPSNNSYVASVASLIPSLASDTDPVASLSTMTTAASSSTAGADLAKIVAATQGVVR